MAHVNRPALIIGGTGLIGERVARMCEASGWPTVRTYVRNERPGAVPLDASDAEQVKRVIKRVDPWLVVNCANAKGGTDACERDPGLADRVHFESARNIVDAARGVGARLVHISTDYVFDGQDGPYGEAAAPTPLSQLGRAKLRAERYALGQMDDALVLRTSFVYGWTPQSQTKNFVMQILDADTCGDTMRVPDDQVGNVTAASNFAQALVELADLGASGVYHVAGTTRCSKYDWAMRVVQGFRLSAVRIEGVSTAELGQAGPRPLQSGFRLEKVQAALKKTRLLSLDEGLADMAREMELAGSPRHRTLAGSPT